MAGGSSGLALVVSANLTELRARLVEAKNELNTTASAMKAMGNAYDGARTIANMNAAFAVVEKLGGVTKLTDAEQARLNTTLNTGIDKLKALGQAVPQNIQAYADQTKAAVTQTQTMNSSTGTLIGSVTKLAGAFGIAFSAAAVIGGIKNLISGALEMASAIDDSSKKLGVSAEKLQGWNAAARLSGASADDISTAVGKMNANLDGGNSSTVQALRRAGLEFSTIRTMKPENAFEAIATAIMKIPDPMTRARVAVELFGKGGQTILPVIMSDIVRVGNAATKMSNETVERLDAAGDAWVDFKNKVTIATGEMLAAAMGSGALNVALAKLTQGQRDYILAQLPANASLEDYQKALIAAAKRHADVNLATEKTGASTSDFTAELAASRVAFESLDPKMRATLSAGLALGKSTQELSDATGVATGVIKLFEAQQQKATEAAKKAEAQSKLVRDAVENVKNATIGLTSEQYKAIASQIQAVTQGGAMVVSEKDIALSLGVTEVAVRKVIEAEKQRVDDAKAELDEWAEIVRQHNKEYKAAEDEVTEFLKQQDEERADDAKFSLDEWGEAVKKHTQDEKDANETIAEYFKELERKHKAMVDAITTAASGMINAALQGWDAFKSETMRVLGDILNYFERVFVKALVEWALGVDNAWGAAFKSIAAGFGATSSAAADAVAESKSASTIAQAEAASSLAGWSIATAGIAALIYGVWKIWDAWKNQDPVENPTLPGGPTFLQNLAIAQALFDAYGQAAAGEEATQFDKFIAIHQELIGYGKGFAAGGIVPPPNVAASDVTPIWATPGEGVVNLRGMGVLGASGLQALNQGQAPTISTAAMERRLASIEALLANQPRAMKLAMKEALVMAA